ncbi:OmpA family protein [Litorivicinus sp.]|nr:OmpA family protein [Litorivicinus sp.]MEC9076672.1 OmpA family protein [Pseudomonadota bacterium]
MKKTMIATTLALAVSAVNAETIESKKPEHIGFGSGVAVGAAIAGPVGVVVGGTLGALIGHDVVQESALARKNQELANLNKEISKARSQLALVNAKQAKTQTEMVALRELLSDLSVAVHFDINSAMTAGQYRQALKAVAKASRSIDGLTVRLIGHADVSGSERYNQHLSEARAASVGQVLQEVGASPMMIRTEGRGEQEALADGQNRYYALDRRVDIQLSFDGKSVHEGLYSVR